MKCSSENQPNASGGAAGAQNDLERVTKMAYAQVAVYGMNEKVRARACATLCGSSRLAVGH